MDFAKELKIGIGLTILFMVTVSVLIFKKEQKTITSVVLSATATSFSKTDVAKHNNRNDCWIVVNNNVYNVTDFLFAHPGGADQIIPYCGGDATEVFGSVGKHESTKVTNNLSSLLIGSFK